MRLRTVIWLLLAGCALTVLLVVYSSVADGRFLVLVNVQPADSEKALSLLAEEPWLDEVYTLKAQEVQLQDGYARRSKLLTCIYLGGSGQASLPGIREAINLGKSIVLLSRTSAGQVLNTYTPGGQGVLLDGKPYPASDSFERLGFWPYSTQKEGQDFAIATGNSRGAVLMVRVQQRFDGNMAVQRLRNLLDAKGIKINKLENLDLVSRQIRLAISLVLLMCAWGLGIAPVQRFLLPAFRRRCGEMKTGWAKHSACTLLKQHAGFLFLCAACLLVIIIGLTHTLMALQKHWVIAVTLLPRNLSGAAMLASIRAWFRTLLLPTGSPSLFLFQLRGAAVLAGISCLALPFSLTMLLRKSAKE